MTETYVSVKEISLQDASMEQTPVDARRNSNSKSQADSCKQQMLAKLLPVPKASFRRLIVLVIFLIAFHYSGGAAIMWLDGETSRNEWNTYNKRCAKELNATNAYLNEQLQALQANDTVNQPNISIVATLVQALDSCHRNTVHLMNTLPTDEYYNAAFLAFTIYTTIGYGLVSPTSSLGQAFVVIYALVACPLFFALVAESVAFADHFSNKLMIICIKRHVCFNSPMTSVQTNQWRYCYIPLALGFVLILLNLIIGSAIMTWITKWTLWANIYFLFQSVAVIGFGDYFVFEQQPWYFLLPWIVVGCMVYMIFALKLQTIWRSAANDIRFCLKKYTKQMKARFKTVEK